MYRKIAQPLILFLVLFLFLSGPVLSLSVSELKQTYNQMTMDDLTQLNEIGARIMNESARHTGYAKTDGPSVGGAGGFFYFIPNNSVNDNKPAAASSVSNLVGGAGGFLFNLNPTLALGGLFGGMGSGTIAKVGNDYYNYSVGGAFEMLHAQYKPIINDNFIIGLDLAAGLAQGSYSSYITDENVTSGEIVRSGSNLAYLCGVDVRKRLLNTLFLGVKLGYLSANIFPLSRGNFTDAGKKLDLSSTYLAVTMGGNF